MKIIAALWTLAVTFCCLDLLGIEANTYQALDLPTVAKVLLVIPFLIGVMVFLFLTLGVKKQPGETWGKFLKRDQFYLRILSAYALPLVIFAGVQLYHQHMIGEIALPGNGDPDFAKIERTQKSLPFKIRVAGDKNGEKIYFENIPGLAEQIAAAWTKS